MRQSLPRPNVPALVIYERYDAFTGIRDSRDKGLALSVAGR